jgi:hypothetical protein
METCAVSGEQPSERGKYNARKGTGVFIVEYDTQRPPTWRRARQGRQGKRSEKRRDYYLVRSSKGLMKGRLFATHTDSGNTMKVATMEHIYYCLYR